MGEISTESESDCRNESNIDADADLDVWVYDNSDQCEYGKEPNHLGNPWHCFGHLEEWFHIARRLDIDMERYNTTLLMPKWNRAAFGASVPVHHFFTPFFRNFITSEDISKRR